MHPLLSSLQSYQIDGRILRARMLIARELGSTRDLFWSELQRWRKRVDDELRALAPELAASFREQHTFDAVMPDGWLPATIKQIGVLLDHDLDWVATVYDQLAAEQWSRFVLEDWLSANQPHERPPDI